jgi:hypothetical protein
MGSAILRNGHQCQNSKKGLCQGTNWKEEKKTNTPKDLKDKDRYF